MPQPAADLKQLAEAAGSDAGRHNPSKEEIEKGSASQLRQESDGQEEEAENEDVRSQCVSTMVSDCHSGEFYIGAIEPRPGSDMRRYRKCQFPYTISAIAASHDHA